MRNVILALSVSFACGVLFAACGASNKCNQSTCASGCCDASGACKSANNLTCGTAGSICTACGLGQTCFSGACTGGTAGGQGGGSGGGQGGGTSGGGGGTTGGGTTGGGNPTGGGPTGGGPTGGGPTGGGPTGGGPTGGGGTSVDCTQQVMEVRGSGGCILTVVAPANCQTLNFSAGYIELAWSTLGPNGFTFCEGPHHAVLLGHPPSTWAQNNGIDVELTSTAGNWSALGPNGSQYTMTRDNGGIIRVVQADLAGIQTPNGQYHFTVTGFYDLNNGGSRAGSITFVVP